MTAPENLIVIWTDVDKIDMPATVGAHTPKSNLFSSGGPKNVGFERVEYTRAISPAAIREAALREACDVVHKWWFSGEEELPQQLILDLIGEKK